MTLIEQQIHKAVADFAEQRKKEIVAEAVKQFDAEVQAAIGKVVLSLAKMYSVEPLRDEILIRVKIDGGGGR